MTTRVDSGDAPRFHGRARSQQAGFSQYVEFGWIDAAAGLAQQGLDKTAAQVALTDLLKDRVSVGTEAVRSTRDKVISILVNVWVAPPERLRAMRDEGLLLWHQGAADERLALHWGMSMAVYPFFASVAESVGRLATLQGEFNMPQLLRRVYETFGERQTITRSAQRVVQSITQWGLLSKQPNHVGGYEPAKPRRAQGAYALWLTEAYLHAFTAGSSQVRSVVRSPALFPFELSLPENGSRTGNHRLEFMRHGLDEDMVAIV